MASFSVVSNIASATAQMNLSATSVGLQRALTRLSSGYRINQSGDDAAGLTVANGYRMDVAVFNQGIRNANDSLSDLQIKDGAMNNITTLLDRMATLAAQSANSKTSASGRSALSAEYDQLVGEITREADVAGLATGGAFSVFVSSANTATQGLVSGTLASVSVGALVVAAGDIDSGAKGFAQITRLRTAVDTLGVAQGVIGTLQNRLQFAISLAQSQLVNTKAAESRVRDANVAEEAANMMRYNILTQSGIAALSQANQSSSAVLALLR
jgi:flagellin